MRKYKICFASVPSDSSSIPFDGLTMREIYSRFVKTGQRPVENSNTIETSEDYPYDPSEDVFSRASAAVEAAVESVPEQTQAPEVEKTE